MQNYLSGTNCTLDNFTATVAEESMRPCTGYNSISGTTITAQLLSNSTLEMLQNKMLLTVLPVLYLLIFFVSVPLNFFSMWILCKSHPRTPTIIFLINLAATDLIYSSTLPFQVVYHLRRNDWPFGSTFCSIATFLFYGNMNCSILIMASISVERYVGIVHPLRCKSFMSVKKALLTCVFIWVFVLLTELPLMYSKLTCSVRELHIVTCFDVLPKNMFPRRVYFYAYFASRVVLFFFLPFLVMGVCYMSIIMTLLQSHTTQLGEAKKQIIQMILVVLLVFTVCYLPNTLISIVHFIYFSKGKTLYVEYKLSLALNSLNCCLDPLVYYLGSKEFRQKVQKTISHCLPTNHLTENITTTTYEFNIPVNS
ncbi:hypothetical protein FKM82_008490 [Ascaphus truei]